MASKSFVFVARRAVTRGAVPPSRTFTTSARCMVNPLLNLSHFSASKEAQFFSKERRIPREEFSPHLQLIRSSEVDPFAPAPGASPSVVAALRRAETGQTDMQTAYSLAISNLGQQVIMSRKEIAQAHVTLARLHEKYKRDERTSFMVMLGSVALLSLILAKTNALSELKDYAKEVNSSWRGFDWEWLGNPPSYKSNARHITTNSSTQTDPVSSVTSNTQRTFMTPIEARLDRQIRFQQQQPYTIPYPGPEPTSSSDRWTISRLFWAGPSHPDR